MIADGMSKDAYDLQGMGGGVVLNAGQTFNGQARFVSVTVDAVLSSYAGNLVGGSTKLTGVTIPAGCTIGGVTTSLGVTSGVVIVYLLDGNYTVA